MTKSKDNQPKRRPKRREIQDLSVKIFGLPACPKQKKKQNPSKEPHGNKTFNKKRFPRRNSHKLLTSKDVDIPRLKIKPKITCYNCGKQGILANTAG